MFTNYFVFYFFLALGLPFSAYCGVVEVDCIVIGTDYPGNDINNFPTNNAHDCQTACQSQSDCNWFTFNTKFSHCFLKSGKGQANTHPDGVTGPKYCTGDGGSSSSGGGGNGGGSSSGGGDDDGCGSFALDGLNVHNKYRALHGSPPLRLKKEICDWAQEWANQLANDGILHHRENNKYGENLFMAGSASGPAPDVTANGAVDSWYNEISKYNYGTGFSMDTGHFTQLVWKASSELGIAKASAHSRTVVVANYSPHGNVEGLYTENVLPPQP